MATLNQLRAYGRIGLLGTTLLLAGSLVLGAWSNYVASRAALDALYRGQAELLEGALRSELSPWRMPDSAALQAFVDSFPQFGVTYIAVVNNRGEVQISVGEPATPIEMPERRGRHGPAEGDLVHAGGRVRLFSRMIVAGPLPEEAFREIEEAAEQAVRTPRPPEIPREIERALAPLMMYNVIDFEPVVASNLVSRASRSLVLAVLSASILTLAALLFWRTSERYAAARVRLEEQRRLSLLGEMSAVLAHEIRNPLASLKGTAQLLAEKLPAGSRELQRAERIVAESIRLETLTSDLLDFARSGPILLEEIDPVALLRDSVAEVNAAEFDLDTADAPGRWKIDARRLRHALVNILQNASQAVPAAAPPAVRVAEEQRRLVFEIRDFGPGLPPDGEQRVFDPFFTTRTNGTGLGLAVAQRVVEMHGGTLKAANHPGGGAVFRIAIPGQPG